MKILVVTPHDAALIEYIRLFKRSNDHEPVFYISHRSKYINYLKANFTTIDEIGSTSGNKIIKEYFLNILKIFLNDTNLGVFIQRYIFCKFFTKKLVKNILIDSQKIDEILFKYSIDSLLISNDRSYGVESAAILSAKRARKSINIICASQVALHASCLSIRKSKVFKCDSKKIKKIFLINGSEYISYKNISFYRLHEYLALHDLGIISKNPWILGMGHIDKCMLESEFDMGRIALLSDQTNQYEVVGSAARDILYNEKYKYEKMQANGKYRTQILLNLPHWYEHKLLEKSEQLNLFNKMFEVLNRFDADITVNLHPKSNILDYKWISDKYNIVVNSNEIAELIPRCDIYIASFSSVNYWAHLCKKKVILINFAKQRYPEIKKFDNEIYTNNIDEFRGALKYHIYQDNDENKNFSNANHTQLKPFDGKSVLRIEKLLFVK